MDLLEKRCTGLVAMLPFGVVLLALLVVLCHRSLLLVARMSRQAEGHWSGSGSARSQDRRRFSHRHSHLASLSVSKLFGYFLRGLVVVAPAAVTVWICVKLFHAIDELLGFAYAGTGFVIMIVLVTLVGFLASTIIAR